MLEVCLMAMRADIDCIFSTARSFNLTKCSGWTVLSVKLNGSQADLKHMLQTDAGPFFYLPYMIFATHINTHTLLITSGKVG